MWFSQEARSDTPERAEASVVVVNCSFLAINSSVESKCCSLVLSCNYASTRVWESEEVP